jgi:hypothetical protein
MPTLSKWLTQYFDGSNGVGTQRHTSGTTPLSTSRRKTEVLPRPTFSLWINITQHSASYFGRCRAERSKLLHKPTAMTTRGSPALHVPKPEPEEIAGLINHPIVESERPEWHDMLLGRLSCVTRVGTSRVRERPTTASIGPTLSDDEPETQHAPMIGCDHACNHRHWLRQVGLGLGWFSLNFGQFYLKFRGNLIDDLNKICPLHMSGKKMDGVPHRSEHMSRQPNSGHNLRWIGQVMRRRWRCSKKVFVMFFSNSISDTIRQDFFGFNSLNHLACNWILICCTEVGQGDWLVSFRTSTILVEPVCETLCYLIWLINIWRAKRKLQQYQLSFDYFCDSGHCFR